MTTVNFEHEYQQKIMRQSFAPGSKLATPADVQTWRGAWMQALSTWHSPYKALVDCSELQISDTPEVRRALDLMVKFFNGFHLRKAVGFSTRHDPGHAALPFPVHSSLEAASEDIGVRVAAKRDPTDFRSTVQFMSHFQTHVVELTFSEPVVIDSKDKLNVVKSKLLNTLMQWHSKWSLLVDCTNLEISEGMKNEFERLLKGLHGFHMKEVIGYSPRVDKATYPFEVYRARHKAAAVLEGEGNFSGDKADCKSRKTGEAP